MRMVQITRPGLGAMSQPIDDDEHVIGLLRSLAPLVPLDAVWEVVDAERLDQVPIPPAPAVPVPAPTRKTTSTTDRLRAAFG